MRVRPIYELSLGGREVRLGERTLVMGVLNVTPDSFSDGGLYLDPKCALERGQELALQGADWIDVGGESTRPGSMPVSEEEELHRVVPIVWALRRALNAMLLPGRGTGDSVERRRSLSGRYVAISIDTTKARVAEAAVRAGATVINDVSGLRFDARLADVARRYRTALVLMHLRGRPSTMQSGPFARSIWRALGGGLGWSIRRALGAGVRRSQLVIDPGMGFGKTRRQNFEILGGLERLRRFRLPILTGTSRKSFVQAIAAGDGLEPARQRKRRSSPGWALLRTAKATRLIPQPLQLGDAAAVTASILGGAHIVRVHDVNAILPAVRIADAILAATLSRSTPP
jgi:dihydropteroate synthase